MHLMLQLQQLLLRWHNTEEILYWTEQQQLSIEIYMVDVRWNISNNAVYTAHSRYAIYDNHTVSRT
jgi:hypothetical protein